MRAEMLQCLKTVHEMVSGTRLLEHVELVWSTEKQFSFSGSAATARHVSSRLREWDVKARTFEMPADGKTEVAGWKAPLGWECPKGLLEIIDPFELRHKVLADRKKTPASVVIGSGPTPPGGITAHVIKISSLAEAATKHAELTGKIVFVAENPRAYKKPLLAAGALGVVSSWSPCALHVPEATAWVDGWADDPERTAFCDGDTPFPAMMISPENGVELDILLDRGPVKLRMAVDAHYAPATMPALCGYIDAPLQEEILAVAPLMNPGANGGASGAAVIIEALRVLQEGTKSGKLPPLRRAARGLFTGKGSCVLQFAAQNPGILRRILAGINLEAVGRHQEGMEASFVRFHCPDASASVSDTLLSMLLEAWLPQALPYARTSERPFELVENVFSDPLFAVPCPAIQGSDRFQNISADTPDNHLSIRAMQAFAEITAAYIHMFATSTAPRALWLARETARRFARRIDDVAVDAASALDGAEEVAKGAILARAFDHLNYVKEIGERAVMSAKSFMLREERAGGHAALLRICRHLRRLVDLEKRRLKEMTGEMPALLPPLPPELAEMAEIRPFRRFLGTPAYDRFSPDEKSAAFGSGAVDAAPRWNAPLHAACFWSDGEHTFAEIARRVEYEYGVAAGAMLARHFNFMQTHGMMLLLKPGEEAPKPERAVKQEAQAKAEEPAEEVAAEEPGLAT